MGKALGTTYTVDEIAAYLRIDRRTIVRLIKDGDLNAHKVGKQYRITQQALDEYLEQTQIAAKGS